MHNRQKITIYAQNFKLIDKNGPTQGVNIGIGFIEKEDQMQAIDDWHYRVESELRLWKNKEQLLTDKINAALEAA